MKNSSKEAYIYCVGIHGKSECSYYKSESAALRKFNKMQKAGIKRVYFYGIPKEIFTATTGEPLP